MQMVLNLKTIINTKSRGHSNCKQKKGTKQTPPWTNYFPINGVSLKQRNRKACLYYVENYSTLYIVPA